MRNHLKAILTKFNLNPVTIREVEKNHYYVSTISGTYLLRELDFSLKKIENLLLTYRLAQQHKLTSIIPLVLTKEGALYLEFKQKLYLVSAWIEKSQMNWENFFQVIAKIHQQTRQTTNAEIKNVVSPVIKLKRVKALKIRHLQWVELFERQAYMSPLELQVCTHYREVHFALQQLERLLITLEETEEKLSVCLIHGNLTREAILGKEIMYIANWENAGYNYPTKDLLSLFKNESMNFNKDSNKWVNYFFHHYLRINPLSKAELYYLAITLLDIEKYLGIVDKYILTDNIGEGMLRTTMELEEVYYKIIMGLHFADALEEHLKNQIQSK